MKNGFQILGFLLAVSLAVGCGKTWSDPQVDPNNPDGKKNTGGKTPSNDVNEGPGKGEGGEALFPAGCPANTAPLPSGPGCTAKCEQCECTSIKITCDPNCYNTTGTCLVNSDATGQATPGAGYGNELTSTCDSLSCVPENDLSTELSCTASQCEPPAPPVVTPPVCPNNSPASFGTKYECYGFSTNSDQVYMIDRINKTVSPLCNTAPHTAIEGFTISPVTGNAFFISQDSRAFGKFSVDQQGACTIDVMGSFPSGSVGGMAFALDGTLYAADENNGQLWRFTKGANSDPLAQWEVIGTLPNGAEGLALNPKNGWLYAISGEGQISAVDPAKPGTALFQCQLPSSQGWDADIMFDKDGNLYAIDHPSGSQTLHKVTMSGNSCSLSTEMSLAPATDIEGAACNIACAYETCVCK